jgi:addiction module RelE/StbE family toxin
MQVRWLKTAAQNLEDEKEYLAKDNPKIAKAFFLHIIESVNQLKAFPDLGRPGRVSGTRELVILKYPYIVPYRVKENSIEILRVFHTSRVWPKLL